MCARLAFKDIGRWSARNRRSTIDYQIYQQKKFNKPTLKQLRRAAAKFKKDTSLSGDFFHPRTIAVKKNGKR